jgi:hypothetical protein
LFLPVDAIAGGGAAPSAKSVIEKAIEFHGGFRSLNNDVPMVRQEESVMTLEGDKIPVTSTWQYQPPDKRAFQAIVKVGSLQLHVRQATIGKKGWAQFGPAPAVDMSPEQAIGMIFEHRNHVRSVKLLPTAYQDFEVGTVSSARFADRDAWKITFTSKNHKGSIDVFFDKSTGQVLGDECERTVPALSPTHEKPSKFKVEFKSYTDVGGAKMPDTMTIWRDGRPAIEVQKSEIRIVDAVDPKVFDKPK